MPNYFAAALKRHSWSLSLLLHLLMLIFFLIRLHAPLKDLDKSPDVSIPSYLYQAPVTPQEMQEPRPLPQKTAQKPVLHDKPTAQEGLSSSHQKMSYAEQVTRMNHLRQAMSSNKETEPVRLIGDKNIDRPFITLLGKAIYKHLVFPKSAYDFGIRGISSIGFVVHPNGGISNVAVVKSSGADVLDHAALTAIMEISPVEHVGEYIHEPTYLVANIIFR